MPPDSAQRTMICFTPGINISPVGTCPLPVIEVRDLRAPDTLVEGNKLYAPFNATAVPMRAATFGGNGTLGSVIRGNQIYRTGIEAGITLAGESPQSGLTTGNAVQGASFRILLQQAIATGFDARVFLNDITGSTVRDRGSWEPHAADGVVAGRRRKLLGPSDVSLPQILRHANSRAD